MKNEKSLMLTNKLKLFLFTRQNYQSYDKTVRYDLHLA